MKWLLTCEHYSNAVPVEYQDVFASDPAVLQSHRGFDLGVAPLYDRWAEEFDYADRFPWSRLLIEPNRSAHHPRLFSEFSKELSQDRKAILKKVHYDVYRDRVEAYIQKHIKEGVMHISLHSFTPSLNGIERNTEVGILYDPGHGDESQWARRWKSTILQLNPSLRVRFNYPYRGNADGFTTYLRKRFGANYRGFELEIKNDVIPEVESLVGNSLKELRSK